MKPTDTIEKAWGKLHRIPGGKLLFSKLIGQFVPYSGTIGAEIVELSPGYCLSRLKDRRGVRNHLKSVHAIALTNLGELTSGLAFNFGLPSNARGIVTRLSIEYHRKARGLLTCECRCPVIDSNEAREVEVEAPIRDESGQTVATFKAIWKIGPARS